MSPQSNPFLKFRTDAFEGRTVGCNKAYTRHSSTSIHCSITYPPMTMRWIDDLSSKAPPPRWQNNFVSQYDGCPSNSLLTEGGIQESTVVPPTKHYDAFFQHFTAKLYPPILRVTRSPPGKVGTALKCPFLTEQFWKSTFLTRARG